MPQGVSSKHIPTLLSQTSHPAGPLIEPIGEPDPQFIEHIMLGRGLQALMPQGLLGLAEIALGELRADEAPKLVRLDGSQAG